MKKKKKKKKKRLSSVQFKMVSVRSEKPICAPRLDDDDDDDDDDEEEEEEEEEVHFSSVQDGICALGKAHNLHV